MCRPRDKPTTRLFPQIGSKGLLSMAARLKKSKLRDARLHLGLSQAEVGDRLGVTGAAIGHYETGVSKPSPDRAAQLARLLGLKPSEVSASERGSARNDGRTSAIGCCKAGSKPRWRRQGSEPRRRRGTRCAPGNACRGAPGYDEAGSGLRRQRSRVRRSAAAKSVCEIAIAAIPQRGIYRSSSSR